MQKSAFDKFIELITFDQSLYKTEKAVNDLQLEVDSLSIELQKLVDTLDAGKDRIRQLRKDVDIRELEMKELDQKEKASRERLDAVKNQQEYQIIKDEVNGLKKKQHDYEETLIKVWNIFETAQKEFKNTEKEITEKREVVQKELQEKQEKVSQLQKELSNSGQERTGKEQDIPEEWLEKYGRMRNSVANPVVLVTNGTCTACFYKIPDQDFLMVCQQKLIQCKGCYRFLYGTQEKEASEEEAASE